MCGGGANYRLLRGCVPSLLKCRRSERFHPTANVVSVPGADKNGQPERLISVKPNFNFVFSDRQIEPLEGPVEVIDDTGVRLVHINFNLIAGFLRVHFDPNGSLIGVLVRPVTIATVTTITVPAVTTITITVAVIAMPVAMPVVVLGIGLGRK